MKINPMQLINNLMINDIPQSIIDIWKYDISRIEDKVDKVKWKISNK